MTELDKAWLESATLKELEDENDQLTEETILITHQLEMANEFGGRSKGWRQKAKMAKACKIAEREKVRRYIKKSKEAAKASLVRVRDQMTIEALRKEVGEDRFIEVTEQLKQRPEWHGC